MGLATTRFTQALLDLEDDEPDVLFDTIPGSKVPLWPQVRMNLSLALSTTEFTSVAVARPDSLRDAVLRAARSFLPSRWDASGLRGRRSLVFLTSGVTTAATPRGEKNWLIGDFAEAFPGEAAILQWRSLRPGPRGRPAFAPTRSLDPLLARAEVRSRLRPPPSQLARIRLLVGEYARRLGGGIADDQLDRIATSAAYGARVGPALERELDRVIERLQPRVVLFDSPVDGGWGAVIAALKRRGVYVAEPQHGWIGPGHGAYNFGAAMRRPELAVELPDELLTFGRFWSESVRYAGKVTTIGKPHFERAMAEAPPVEDRPREILVVSSVGEPDETSSYVLALAAALPAPWRVRFRPHPSERAVQARRYPRLVADRRVILDDRHDVVESLAAARIVVGVASTVLFEAAGMGCRVFVRETPYVPVIVGDTFGVPVSGAEGITRIVDAAMFNGAETVELSVDVDALWQRGAIDRFRVWAQCRKDDDDDAAASRGENLGGAT